MPNKVTRKVLHVAPTPFFSDRGCHIRIRGLVRGLESVGVTSLVCTYGLGDDVSDVATVRCPKIPGYTKTAAGPSLFRFIADPLLVWTVSRQIRLFGPDVLHCHLHEGVLIGWLARYLALRPQLRIVFDMQGGLGSELISYGHLKNLWLRKLVHWIETFIVNRADAYSCSSEVSVNLLLDEFGVESSRIKHVPDGTDIEIDLPRPTGAADGNTPVAVYTGGLVESKGLTMLKAIIKESADRGLDLRFIVVGYPDEDLRAFVRTHDLRNCEPTGRIPFGDLPEFLASASICIEPKSAETTEASGKLLNYMASGRPTVCFDTPNNRKILGPCGYYAKETNAVSFVDQLQVALSDPNEAWRRGAKAKELVTKYYSWQSSANHIMQAYATLTA